MLRPSKGDEIALAPTMPKKLQALEEQDEFDWGDTQQVVVDRQPATAVYINLRDQIVILQEARHYDDEEAFVYFDRLHIPALIAALRRTIGETAEPETIDVLRQAVFDLKPRRP
jgi:hypothetical protein